LINREKKTDFSLTYFIKTTKYFIANIVMHPILIAFWDVPSGTQYVFQFGPWANWFTCI